LSELNHLTVYEHALPLPIAKKKN
jgi:hypothetical protein